MCLVGKILLVRTNIDSVMFLLDLLASKVVDMGFVEPIIFVEVLVTDFTECQFIRSGVEEDFDGNKISGACPYMRWRRMCVIRV
jgi:hypothetical protein